MWSPCRNIGGTCLPHPSRNSRPCVLFFQNCQLTNKIWLYWHFIREKLFYLWFKNASVITCIFAGYMEYNVVCLTVPPRQSMGRRKSGAYLLLSEN